MIMLPDYGLITKADKQKLDSIPSETLLTAAVANETYLTKSAAAEIYITSDAAVTYINNAIGGGGSSSVVYETVDVAGEVTINNDGVYILGSNSNDTIYNNASNVTIDGGKGSNKIFNSGANIVYIYNSDAPDTICGFTDSDTLIVSGENSAIIPTNTGALVSVDANYVLLRGPRITGTTGFSAENFLVMPAGTTLNIKNAVTQFHTRGRLVGDSVANNLTNNLDYMYIDALAGNDTVRNSGDYVTIDGGEGLNSIKNDGDYVWVKGGTAADSIYSTGDFCTIDGGNGNNYFNNSGYNVLMIGGNGADSVVNTGAYCTLQASAGAAYVTLNSNGVNSADFCYIETNGAISISANTQAPTISVANGAASVSLGADCSYSSLVCAGAYQDIIRTTGNPRGGNGHHYFYTGLATSSKYDTFYLYDGYNTIEGSGSVYHSILTYDASNSGGNGSTHNYFDYSGVTAGVVNASLYGGSNDTILCGTATTNIRYISNDAYPASPQYCSIVGGAGALNVTLPYGSDRCTINSGAGSEKIFSTDTSQKRFVYCFGTGEGSNTILGLEGQDTIYIKDNSIVTNVSNNSNGWTFKVGTTTILAKGLFIDGSTNVGAAASYASLESNWAACRVKYANSDTPQWLFPP